MLDDRKRRILKAIIDDYINTVEPIGSRTIARRHELNLSSATIRNEMADLEELGFLVQPHTSSGRVPSDKGYRFYVDELLELDELSIIEIENVRIALENKMVEIDHLIKAAANILSNSTNYTSIVSTPNFNNIMLKALQLVWIEENKVLIVLVVDGNIVKNSMVRVLRSVNKDELNIVNNFLNEKLSSVNLYKIETILNNLENKNIISNEVFEPIKLGILDCVSQIDNMDYFLNGTRNIFNFPEFKNLDKAMHFLEMMEKRDSIIKMLQKKNEYNDIRIKIGYENEIIEAKDCSIIITDYSISDSVIGTIGIIGPTRMEYSKVIKYLNHVRKKLNEEISKMLNG